MERSGVSETVKALKKTDVCTQKEHKGDEQNKQNWKDLSFKLHSAIEVIFSALPHRGKKILGGEPEKNEILNIFLGLSQLLELQ